MKCTLAALVTVKTMMAVLLVAVTLAAPAHADPLRCKDAPVAMGPFPTTAHICDNGNGTVTSCYTSALPVAGGQCHDWPSSSLPPGFWDNP